MRLWLRRACLLLIVNFLSSGLPAQTPSPTSGEITVQLTQGLDSGTNPEGTSPGRVTKSTNAAIPVGSTVVMGLGSDPVNGGYTVKLLRLGINGQMEPAASSNVVTAPDFINLLQEKARAKGQPQDAVSGTRVFLPAKMIIRFTLTTPSPEIAGSSRQKPERTQAPPQTKGWVLDKLPEIGSSGQDVVQSAAILNGQTIMKGQTSGAYLVMHCDFPTIDYPGMLPLEVILGGTDEMFNVPGGAPGAFVDISDLASSQLGTASRVELNAKGLNRSNGARVRFFYDAQDMAAIVNGAGETLKLSISSGSSSAPEAVAVFTLPSDNAPVKQLMSACLQKSAAEAEALQAKTVAACPDPKDGKILNSVALKYADSGKELKGDMSEEDYSGLWKLPAAAKGKPVRKILMTCAYRNAGTAEGTAATDNETVPVPTTARTCDFTVHKNPLHSSSVCLSTTSRDAALAEVSEPKTSQPGGAGQKPDAQGGLTAASTADTGLPTGPVAPVNRLNVRGISVRMGRGQILAAAKAAGMVVQENHPEELKIVDPTASGRPFGGPMRPGGSGLILIISLKNNAAVEVSIYEQDAFHGETFEDIQKKWGKPTDLPRGYDNELGTQNRATWGDKKTIYADWNPSLYSNGGQSVTIYDAVALTPHPQARKGVSM